MTPPASRIDSIAGLPARRSFACHELQVPENGVVKCTVKNHSAAGVLFWLAESCVVRALVLEHLRWMGQVSRVLQPPF